MPRIFISYSKADRPAALRLRNRIEALGFETPFIDIEIKPGTQWERELYVQLERCLAVLFHMTPNWRESEFCFAEYIQARILGKPI
ncbi:MAG: toll/interleukin-1 receptor domain-containing protein, partial [Caldilineaceae bacterium]